jgi:hypothetical protein
MALIAVSGHPGCRFEELARISAQRLGFELLAQSRIRALTDEEFGAGARILIDRSTRNSVWIITKEEAGMAGTIM